MLKKRHNDFYLSTQSFMPVLDNLQLEINHLQNYVKKYTALWHMSSNIDVTIHYMCCRQDYVEVIDVFVDGGI